MKAGYVYIVTNKPKGTLYIGVTSNLIKRIWEHKNELCKGFTSKYHLHRLVYYEVIDTMECAIMREKQMKKFLRYQKIKLIETMNPEWIDLYQTIIT